MKNFFANNLIFAAILSGTTVAASATHNGLTISKPSQYGRQLTFALQGNAAETGVTTLTVRVEGRVGSGAWEAVKDVLGNDLTFDAADTIAANTTNGLAGGVLTGTLPIDRLKYDDYRLAVVTVAGATATVSAVAIVSDLYEVATNRKDHFYFKVTPFTEKSPVNTLNR